MLNHLEVFDEFVIGVAALLVDGRPLGSQQRQDVRYEEEPSLGQYYKTLGAARLLFRNLFWQNLTK